MDQGTRLILQQVRSRRLRALWVRFFCDLLAVAVGATAFDLLAGPPGPVQIGWALTSLALAVLIDVSHTRREWTYVEEMVLALKVGLGTLVICSAIAFLLSVQVSRIFVLSVLGTLVVSRPVTTWALDRVWPKRIFPHRVLLVCSDEEYAAIVDAMAEQPAIPHHVVGRVSEDKTIYVRGANGSLIQEQSLTGIANAFALTNPTRLVLGASPPLDVEFSDAVLFANSHGVTVKSFPSFFEDEYGRVPLASLRTSWFLFDIGTLHRIRYRVARRLVDIVAGLLLESVFFVLSPLLWVLVNGRSRGPFLYHQTRVGQHGREFRITKLRTMRTDAEESGPQFAQDSDPRITCLGRFLRGTRLDELPQGWNLIRGEMSLVGPRPERPEFVRELKGALPLFEKRLLIKPGLTGSAQVHEGYSASASELRRKLERDLYYVKNQSLSLDARIILATVYEIFNLAGR